MLFCFVNANIYIDLITTQKIKSLLIFIQLTSQHLQDLNLLLSINMYKAAKLEEFAVELVSSCPDTL